MSIFRIEKTKDYTVMSNYHFKEKNMSLKAKGLLSLMLSLPDNWNYSMAGLVAICKENETSIKTALDELKDFGYLQVHKLMPNETKTGRIEYLYMVFEKPTFTVLRREDYVKILEQDIKKQALENLGVENQSLENPIQLNNNKLNIKVLNTKHKYGEYQHVLLTDDELNKLKELYSNWQELITYLDEYIEMKGYKAKSHYLCIRKWVVDAVKQKNNRNGFKGRNYKEQDMNKLFDDFDSVEL